MHNLVRKLYLKAVLFAHAKTCIKRSNINDGGEGSCSAIKTNLHRAESDRNIFIVWLVGLHGAHRAEAGIAASLGKD